MIMIQIELHRLHYQEGRASFVLLTAAENVHFVTNYAGAVSHLTLWFGSASSHSRYRLQRVV